MATLVLLAVAAASIAFSLAITPLQRVDVLGQTVGVGTAPPTLSLSGPGELDLFGQRLPTMVRFAGPVRPRAVLSNITINRKVAFFLHPSASHPTVAAVGEQLANAWKRYFAWEIGFVALGAVLLLLLIAGWRHVTWRRTIALLVGGLLMVEGINAGLVMLTAFTAPRVLGGVHSLNDLVGRAEPHRLPAAGPSRPNVQAVVIGDSTAAGIGNAPLSTPTDADRLCDRSADAYSEDLALVNGWSVANLSCSGATIRSGLLGSQKVHGHRLPPQVALAERVPKASFIIVSVGANDLRWSDMLRLCAISVCTDRASVAYFRRTLARFTSSYYALLETLATLPGRPRVVVNLYYTPFAATTDCLSPYGLAPSKLTMLLGRLDELNEVLAGGARAFGALAVQPDFGGHELCTPQPFVQGLHGMAPFHPNVGGELAIALADERAIAGS